jgi:hypothetical protein
VIRFLALLGIPSALIFGAFIDETRGLPLEVAAKEDEWANAKALRRGPHRGRATAAD